MWLLIFAIAHSQIVGVLRWGGVLHDTQLPSIRMLQKTELYLQQVAAGPIEPLRIWVLS